MNKLRIRKTTKGRWLVENTAGDQLTVRTNHGLTVIDAVFQAVDLYCTGYLPAVGSFAELVFELLTPEEVQP